MVFESSKDMKIIDSSDPYHFDPSDIQVSCCSQNTQWRKLWDLEPLHDHSPKFKEQDQVHRRFYHKATTYWCKILLLEAMQRHGDIMDS